jgi:hypothetical protein
MDGSVNGILPGVVEGHHICAWHQTVLAQNLPKNKIIRAYWGGDLETGIS